MDKNSGGTKAGSKGVGNIGNDFPSSVTHVRSKILGRKVSKIYVRLGNVMFIITSFGGFDFDTFGNVNTIQLQKFNKNYKRHQR